MKIFYNGYSSTLVVDLLLDSGAVQRSSVARGIEVRGHVNRSCHVNAPRAKTKAR